MANLKPGSVVWLKSGSPKMTVSEIQDGGEALCIWFDKNGKKEELIPIDLLTDQDPNSTGSSPITFTR